MTQSRIMLAVIAFFVAVMTLLWVLPEGRAQTQTVIPPPLSTARYQYFANHPDEWSQLLSKLQQGQAATAQGTSSAVSPWSNVTATGLSSSVSLSNPLLLTDGTVIVHNA